jgi:hypothetical protein
MVLISEPEGVSKLLRSDAFNSRGISKDTLNLMKILHSGPVFSDDLSEWKRLRT